MQNRSTCGIIYIATGDSYRAEALTSAFSLKRHWPELSTLLMTDIALDNGCFDSVETIDAQFDYVDKVRYLGAASFERAVFLDSDTICLDRFPEVFALLNDYDIAMAHAPGRISSNNDTISQVRMQARCGIPICYPEFNTGVIAFRRTPGVLRLFDQWLLEYQAGRQGRIREAHDQASLRRLLYSSDLRVAVLPAEYNFRLPCSGFAADRIKIAHGRWSDIPLPHDSSDALMKKLDSVLNAKICPRVYAPNLGVIIGGAIDNVVSFEALEPQALQPELPAKDVNLQLQLKSGSSRTFLCPVGEDHIAAKILAGEYNLEFLGDFEPTLIVDVGANIGATSLYFYSKYPSARIVAIEPSKRAFDYLQRNTLELSNIEVHHCGLWDAEELRELHLGAYGTVTNSLFEHVNSSTSREVIQLCDALRFFERQDFSAISILKIDTEGCEIKILARLEPFLSKIDIIFFEYHSEDDRRLLDALLSNNFLMFRCDVFRPHRGTCGFMSTTLASKYKAQGYLGKPICHGPA